MWQLSRQNISRQIKIGRNFLEPQYLPFEQNGPGEIQTHDLCRPRRIR